MGRLAAEDMIGQAGEDRALAWHLGSNHFPPIPEVFDAAREAIARARDGDWDALVQLPGGVSWRDADEAPVWACVEGWHLDAFLRNEEDEDA